MEKNKYNFARGMRSTPNDKRDFSLTKVFGALDPINVPNQDFFVGNPKIKNQGSSDLCTAFAGTLASEYQEGVILSPEWFFAMIKKMRNEFKSWGADLRSIMKAATKVGFLEQKDAPFTLKDKARDFVANWKNWSVSLLPLARKHAKKSFFKVDGKNGTFDNIRVALWENRGQRQAVITGCTWRQSWTYAKGGVIPKGASKKQYGHAFVVDGQKMIKDVPHLRVPNSGGVNIGDGGFFYFPKEVVNRDFRFKKYILIDMDPVKAKKLNKRVLTGQRKVPPKKNNSWVDNFWDLLVKLSRRPE